MAPYPCPGPGNAAYAVSRALFDVLITRLGDPLMATRPEHAVEEFIAGAGRDVLRQALQDHLDARAAAEQRLPEVTGADEVTRRRAEPGHTRLLSTTLGPVEVTRIAYRHPGVSNLHPADARLALPEGWYSFPLQQAVIHESVTGALRQAHDGLDRILGTRIGTRQLMQITTDAARDVRDFYAQHPVPARAVQPGNPAGPRDLLVLSIDATGINMIDSGLRDSSPVRDDGPQPPSAQLSCRERTGRTRMAVVTAVYDAAPAVRSPADVMPTGAAERATRRPGPKAVNRQVDASIVDSTAPMTTRLFDRAEQRDPHHLRRWIVLVDGNNHQIDRINAEAHARGVRINLILDFVHVLEYLWKAADDLHPTHPARPRRLRRPHRPRPARTPSRPGHRRLEKPARHRHRDRRYRTRAETLHRLPHRETALPHLPHRADHGLAHRDRRHRGRMPLPGQRPPRDHRRPLEPAQRRSRPATPNSDHQRRLRRLLEVPPPARTPTHPHQPLPAPIRPRRLTKIAKVTQRETHP
ncbi:hypothetical protein, partial [Actinoplanes derwentensis]|uniref:hypothetical protein n=1 Tax=Actinoplanes derwentensis TaxID=113562 RepID=UPI0035A229C3